MTFKAVKSEIDRFLISDESEALVLRGAWGVGKTYIWNKLLIHARDTGRINIDKYTYVSLFGINSLEELKFALFENQIATDLIGSEPSISTLRDNTTSLIQSLGKKSFGLMREAPIARNFLSVFKSFSFFSLSKSLICIDDFERKGESLSARNILGLISNLKEHKDCKVVLILNDAAQSDDSDDYEKFKEKAIDIEIMFEPDPKECVDIALTEDSKEIALLRDRCLELKISNIRVIKKTERLLRLIKPHLDNYHEGVFRQVIHSLALFSACYYKNHEYLPTLDFIETTGPAPLSVSEDKEGTPQEKLWQSTMMDYGFMGLDELDLEIMSIVRSGFVNVDNLTAQVRVIEEKLIAEDSDSSFSEAWNLYHGSFDSNEEEVKNAIYVSFKDNVRYISPINLNGTVKLLRDLDENEKAEEIIDLYVKTHSGNRGIFDLDNYVFAGELSDPGIRQKFLDEYNSSSTEKSLKAAALAVSGSSWGSDDVRILKDASVDEFYDLFKTTKGDELGRVINSCLKFGRFANSSDDDKSIYENAVEALMRIGRESRINARRITRFGIKLD